MTNEDARYCTECGMKLAPEDKFCPSCGASIDEMTSGSGITSGVQQNYAAVANEKSLKTLSYLMLFWGILATIYGIYVIVTTDSTVDSAVQMLKDEDLWTTLTDAGFDENTLKTICYVEGGCLTVSGVFSLVAGHFTYRRTNYKIASLTCMIATIASFIGVITLIIGIFITYRLTQNKNAFSS